MRALIVIALLAVTPLAAQSNPCPDNLTIVECFEKFAPTTLRAAEAAAVTDRAAASEAADVAREVTGVPAVDTVAGNATRDFLALFAAAVENADFSEDGDALTLEWNLRLGAQADPVKLQAIVRRPTLWEAFSTSLASDDERDRLLGTLDDRDDLTLSATYAPENKRFGRRLAPHRDIFSAILSAVPNRVPAPSADELDALLQRLAKEGVPPFEDADELDTIKFEDIEDVTLRELVREKVLSVARQTRDMRAEFDRAIVEAGVDRFSELLNNQPQLYFGCSAREREKLIGPNERKLTITYEMGFVNINTFRASDLAKGVCPDRAAECAAAFADYVGQPDVIAGLDAANRFAITFEHNWVDEYDIVVENIAPFHVQGSTVTSGSLTYGRILHQSAQQRDGRIDVKLTYDDIKNDEDHDNRWIGSAIYTQKLTDTLSLPIGVVWANHEADVPAADDRVSVHVGLIYKLVRTTP